MRDRNVKDTDVVAKISSSVIKFLKDNRALSDAVVVAIFVGVAVVMGALIASFSLSRAPTTAAPSVSLSITPIDATTVGIHHKGGEAIPFEHVRVYLYDRNMSTMSGYPTLATGIASRTDTAPTGVFNTGDVLRLTGLSAGVYRVSIEHVPSKQVIADTWVTVG